MRTGAIMLVDVRKLNHSAILYIENTEKGIIVLNN
jgi:hypothetical protein